MKVNELTKGQVALVDDVDYEWVSQWSWCLLSSGYAVRSEKRDGVSHMVLMHREIAIRMGIELTEDSYVDHINRNRLDNRRSNLRAATPTQSSYNVAHFNKHGYRGVLYVPFCYSGSKRYERKKPWQARIRIDSTKRTRSLGYYATVEEAARAYDEAARLHHREFATLNFPKEIQS